MTCARVEALPRDTVVRELMRPLAGFLDIAGATEVVVNRACELFVEVGPIWERHEVPSLTIARLISMAQAIATFTEQELSPQKPILSAILPGGQRIQIVVPPVVEPEMISFSIRLPAAAIKSLGDYRAEGAFDRFVWARPAGQSAHNQDIDVTDRHLMALLEANDLVGFFDSAVKSKKNIAIVGETGSGKTTLMKSICQAIPAKERIITIEDVRELFLPRHPNSVHLLYSKGDQGVARVSPAQLIASTMRMKPDRVLLAELRGSEAFDFLKLLTTGHSGSVTSFHAESCRLAAERYVFMCKEHEDAKSYDSDALKALVKLTIDIIVHVTARTTQNSAGLRKERYVSEVNFNPVAKLNARFDQGPLHHAGTRP